MEYLDNIITRLAEKCTAISPSGDYAGSFGGEIYSGDFEGAFSGTVDSDTVTADSGLITTDTI